MRSIKEEEKGLKVTINKAFRPCSVNGEYFEQLLQLLEVAAMISDKKSNLSYCKSRTVSANKKDTPEVKN